MTASNKQEFNLPPYGITVDEHSDYRHYTIRLSGWEGWYIRLFKAALSLGAWIWCIEFALDVQNAPDRWAKYLPLFHATIALILTYLAIAEWRNSTHLFLGRNAIEVYQAPMWMPGHKRIDTAEVGQLYVKHNHRSRYSRIELRVKRHNKADDKVLRITYPLDHALYLEREIERYLDIKNREVVGEYKPNKGFWDP